jgi:CHAT domain-containing protein
MKNFYHNLDLDKTNNIAQALRQAMLSTKKDHPALMHWASFIVMGAT